jgi:hypothetical protein
VGGTNMRAFMRQGKNPWDNEYTLKKIKDRNIKQVWSGSRY